MSSENTYQHLNRDEALIRICSARFQESGTGVHRLLQRPKIEWRAKLAR